MGSRASPTIASISHCTPVAHTGTSTTRKNQRENPSAAMTASTIPPHEQSDNTDNTESRPHTSPDWWDHHRPITSDEYSDMALMLGAHRHCRNRLRRRLPHRSTTPPVDKPNFALVESNWCL